MNQLAEALQVDDPQWWQKVQAGELTQDQLRATADQQWGVVKELQVKLRTVKGCASDSFIASRIEPFILEPYSDINDIHVSSNAFKNHPLGQQ